MEIEAAIARHYTHGDLDRAILAGLKAMGRDIERIDAADLAAIDEFHMGGHEATVALAERLALQPGMVVLDIGCGIGGAVRLFARRYSATVRGVDVTPEYIQVAKALTRRVGLSDRVDFQVGSAFELPFAPASFDCATLLHVGMNIPEKARLCRAVHRLLKPDGLFAIYDVMRTGEGEICFPVPWAPDESISFLERAQAYRDALEAAGFIVARETSRRDLAIDFFSRMQARIAESGPPPLGLHVLMGSDAKVKIANLIAALEAGVIAPVEMIARRDG